MIKILLPCKVVGKVSKRFALAQTKLFLSDKSIILSFLTALTKAGTKYCPVNRRFTDQVLCYFFRMGGIFNAHLISLFLFVEAQKARGEYR